jgi:hypothetical protein
MDRLDQEKCHNFQMEVMKLGEEMHLSHFELWYACQDLANMAVAEVSQKYLAAKQEFKKRDEM